MNIKRILTAAAVLLGSVTTVTLVAPQIASAHHANLDGNAARPCGADAAWTATWSATSWDPDGGKDWSNRYRIQLEGADIGNWVPGGDTFGEWLDDGATFGPHTLPNLAADVDWVRIWVQTDFTDNVGTHDAAPYPLEISRPPETACPTTTTTTSTTTTTTEPSTTTTTTDPTTTTTTTEPSTTTTTTDPTTTTTTTEPSTTTTTTTEPSTTTTTTTEPSTTTDPSTTTTTTYPSTTTTDPSTTTTDAAQSPPPDGPTTTLLVAPTTVGQGPAGAPELPATGSDSAERIAGFGAALLAAGWVIVMISRRRPASTSDMI